MSILEFTGNPLIDSGNAVITMMCGKKYFHEVTREDIFENIDEFLQVIKDHFNYSGASEEELNYARRGLKKHCFLIYNGAVNGIFGNNAYLTNPVTGQRERVQNAEQFIKRFKEEIQNIFDGSRVLFQDPERVSLNNICKFCGRPADIIITKDIVPLATGLSQKNLGQVHSCIYCYLPILFNFVVMINVRDTQKSTGTYMFYNFSNEQYMIEYAKQQFQYLKSNPISSLQTIIGSKYEVVVDDLIDRLPKLKRSCEGSNSFNAFTTAYFLKNDNRGASFKFINVPDGVCSFLIRISNTENVWKQIKHNLINREDYNDFFTGGFQCIRRDGTPKYGFEDEKILKIYLREVSNVDDKLISATEAIAKGLLKFYRSQGANWVQKYDKEINVEKPYNFINGLLDVNEEYFKLHGDNILTVSDVKQVVQDSSMAFRLIKYFMHNNMNEDEKKSFIDINRKRTNQDKEEE